MKGLVNLIVVNVMQPVPSTTIYTRREILFLWLYQKLFLMKWKVIGEFSICNFEPHASSFNNYFQTKLGTLFNVRGRF